MWCATNNRRSSITSWKENICKVDNCWLSLHFSGVISAVESLKTSWKLNTKMPEFTLQMWAMTKLTEVLHCNQVTQLDIEKIPKMIRGSVIRNLSKFSGLRRLMFGSSSGDMTVHITKGASLYTNLCSAVGRMDRLVQFTMQYNCTQDILQGSYERQ